MIVVDGLRRSFGSTRAVDSISFKVPHGEIYGLLGPNGAGKTTTIACLCGLLRPDGGQITLDGIDRLADPIRARRTLGVVPQETAIYDSLSAAENVSYFASLHGLAGPERRRRVEEALERVGLTAVARQAAGKFSGGMKRRLNLAIGLVSAPRILLLDEPTVGIDPQARMRILEVIREVRREGAAVLYTTHHLEEAQDLCDRIGILDHGKLLAEGTVPELRRLAGEETLVTLRGRIRGDALRHAVDGHAGARVISIEDSAAVLAATGETGGAAGLLASVLRSGVEIAEVSIQEPNLQAVFIRLTGRALRD